MAKLIIDLDGVLCEIRRPEQEYIDVVPLAGAIEKMQALKKAGHYLIINTARHMKTCNSNVGLINKRVGKATLDWLEKYEIPYDELHFGKPHGAIYLDDNAWRFNDWSEIDHEDLDNDIINIVIPMAGEGKRFLEQGVETPKPLLELNGKKCFEWATESFKEIMSKFKTQLYFVVRDEHVQKYEMDIAILKSFPQAKIIKVPYMTLGQADSVLYAERYINNLNKLIIFNADTYFDASSLIEPMMNEKPDGLIPCFESSHPRYSYVELDDHGKAKRTVEKEVISNNASNGCYYFKYGKDFVLAASQELSRYKAGIAEGEAYIMPCYQKLISSSKSVLVCPADNNVIFGTPEEFEIAKGVLNK